MSADRREYASETKIAVAEVQSLRMDPEDFGLVGARSQAMPQDKSPES